MIATGMTVTSVVIVIETLLLAVTDPVRLTAVTMTGMMISVMMTGEGLVPPQLEGMLMIGGRMTTGVIAGETTAVILTSVEMVMEVGTVVVAGRSLQS